MQNLFWGASRQGTHGKIIILMLPDGKLHLEILEGKESLRSIKQLFMEHDWLAISSEIAYPITISGTTYTDSTVFLDASDNFDSNLNEDFFSYLKEEDCVEMFINSQGIMLGATGQAWIADVLDDKSNSHGLKIITINDLLKE